MKRKNRFNDPGRGDRHKRRRRSADPLFVSRSQHAHSPAFKVAPRESEPHVHLEFSTWRTHLRPRGIDGLDIVPENRILIAVDRHERILRLRREYAPIVSRLVFGLAEPKESLNRWLMERRLHQTITPQQPYDPLLPYTPSLVHSPLLYRELSDDLPFKVMPEMKSMQHGQQTLLSFTRDTRRYLAEDATTGLPFTPLERVQIEDALTAAHLSVANDCNSPETFTAILHQLRDVVRPIIKRKMHLQVIECCETLEKTSIQSVQELYTTPYPTPPPTAPQEPIRVFADRRRRGMLIMKRGSLELPISVWHMAKLKDHYRGNYRGDHYVVERHIFLLLLRYFSFFGETKPFEGSGHQGAVPPAAMRVLETRLGVCMEVFASPLNCYFRSYCSAFLDTDYVFGSVGDFFSFNPIEGSFECNPPFVEELMIQMGHRIKFLIDQAESMNTALSFVVVMPHWDDAESIINMKNMEPQLKRMEILGKKQHSYAGGFQHKTSMARVMYRAVHETCIFFVQSTKGAVDYPVTDEIVEELKRAFI